MVMSFTCVQGYWDWVKQYTPKRGKGRQAEAEMSQARGLRGARTAHKLYRYL
jgi:hypothetical protein